MRFPWLLFGKQYNCVIQDCNNQASTYTVHVRSNPRAPLVTCSMINQCVTECYVPMTIPTYLLLQQHVRRRSTHRLDADVVMWLAHLVLVRSSYPTIDGARTDLGSCRLQ